MPLSQYWRSETSWLFTKIKELIKLILIQKKVCLNPFNNGFIIIKNAKFRRL